MIIKLTFKTPDVIFDAIDHGDYNETQRKQIVKTAEKFVEHGEYITVELDTEKGTCIVVPR